jgi:hypothetical protein
MELSAVGERVFAAEALLKRRIRKVGASGLGPRHRRALPSEPGFPPPAAAQLPFPQVPAAAAAVAAAAALSPTTLRILAAMHRLHGWGAGWGNECRCMHFAAFRAGVMQRARAFGGGVWSIHLVHAFSHYFLCLRHAFLPVHTHTHFPLCIRRDAWNTS